MHPVLFKIGPLSLYSYGFMLAIAFLVGIFASFYYAKREGIKPEAIFDLAIYVIIAGVVGSRLLYVIGRREEYRSNLSEIFMVQKGGLVFLGGLLAALLAIVFYARVKKINLWKLLDAITPGTVLGYALGRIGCFLNGCCFGLPTNAPWGVIFPPDSLAYSYFPGQPLHPAELYSFLSMFMAFIALIIIYRFKRFDGQVFFWGLIIYSIYRFLVEFIRYSPIHWLGLTPSQWLVIPVAVLAAYLLVRFQGKIAS